jgi:hypothetical protein
MSKCVISVASYEGQLVGLSIPLREEEDIDLKSITKEF